MGAKSNEIPMLPVLLDRIQDVEGMVDTADALHAQRYHAEYLHDRGAHYLVPVKGNQPSLHRQLRSLPWKQVCPGHREREYARGRITIRTIKAVAIEADIDFPHAAQVVLITPGGARSREARGAPSSATR